MSGLLLRGRRGGHLQNGRMCTSRGCVPRMTSARISRFWLAHSGPRSGSRPQGRRTPPARWPQGIRKVRGNAAELIGRHMCPNQLLAARPCREGKPYTGSVQEDGSTEGMRVDDTTAQESNGGRRRIGGRAQIVGVPGTRLPVPRPGSARSQPAHAYGPGAISSSIGIPLVRATLC